MLRNADLSQAVDVWRIHDGIPTTGTQALETISSQAYDALCVIDSATSYAKEKQREREIAAAMAKKG